LIGLGLKPSVEFKKILNKVYALQLEGKVSTVEEAIAYAKVLIQKLN